MFALEFPPINEILRWTDVVPSVNKIALIAIAAVVVASVIFLIAGNADGSTAPRGVRNLAESIVEFIEGQIIMPTMGRDGLGWTPFLLSLFSFIYLCNVPGVIPIIQMPATARMAIPLFLSLLVWVIFIGVGFKHQGIGYLKNSLFPPGVPAALYLLVTPIEFISTFLVRPFSLTVRLFANMLAGHILLVTFALLTEELVQGSSIVLKPVGILPFFMLVFLTAFEVLVAFLQAYIFTILAAVYIGGAAHPEH
ncbi:MAG: F0F1 ATP synthase subunit A [Ilumatobacteraceae bacterium]|nr:F0F1 ATP synthase subunit A [Ilumatobacteraceae bacterium]MBL6759850.1 F0F1 ATP synthase subunit A [Ilumatobacteraceae bacterium]